MDLEQGETCSITSTSRLARSAAASPSFATTSTNAPTYPTPLTQSPPVPPRSLTGLPIPPVVADPRTNPKRNSNSGINYSLVIPSDSTLGKLTSCFSKKKNPPQNPVGAYQPPPHGMNSPHSMGSPHSQSIAASPYEQQDFSCEFRGSPYDGESGEQGWRGNNCGRGRGTRGDGFDSTVRRPVDSGWPRRPRNEGPAGGPSW